MREIVSALLPRRCRRTVAIALALGLLSTVTATNAAATDRVYFSAVDNVTDVLVRYINAENVRLDISSWYLSEHAISIAIANRFAAGVQVRLMGDRGALFENDPHTKNEFYWLASQGVPIRLRFNPTWFPEIDHWKMALFVGQNTVEFGSGNFAPTELAPVSSTNYDDETELVTDDPALVNAFKTKFDVMWNDTTREPSSIIASPPYFKDWNDACANEPTGGCADYHTLYPNPAPMIINTARLEGNNPMPADLIWGQGSEFNNRLTQEIYNENSRIDLIVYRLEVDNITEAILAKFHAGVPIRLIIDPIQYTKITWPEYWLTHANIDKLWAAGVPIRQALHAGVAHMKTLVTSTYASNASSNFGPNWQRDHDYFVSATTKPTIYQAIANRVDTMWNDTVGFGPLRLTPPNAADLASPASNVTGVASTTSLVWNIAAWAVSYDVYLGTSQSNMTLVANVPAQLVLNPPTTYSWTPTVPLQLGTAYVWKIVSRTNATPLVPSMIASSLTWSFTTAGITGPPAAPTTPSPSDGATNVATAPTLGWSTGAIGTTYTVAIGTTSPPAQVATGLSTPSYAPGTLAPSTTYYWRVTAVSAGSSTPGAIWSFVTGAGSGGGAATDVAIYASDVAAADIHGAWSQIADATAAAGIKLSNPDAGAAALGAPRSTPTDYFDASFQAVGSTRYRVWLRMHATGNSKWNDSLYVQFSDGTDVSGNAIYRTGTTGGLLVNLATDSTGTSDQGWGWQRNAYWLSDSGDVWFQNSGVHTIRVQVREDGVEIDQIVISPVTYATNPPGPVSNDNTIVAKPALPPSVPGLPGPPNGANGVDPDVSLTWNAVGATSYDVDFGTSNPPPLVSTGQTGASYGPGTLNNATTYFWQVVAHNTSGATSGAVWSFTTAIAAPATPSAPNPSSGATGAPTTLTLTWSSGGATSVDVLFGTANPPPQVSTGQTGASYAPPTLTINATYFWQIVAHNAGGTTSGPVWSFSTTVTPPPPPGTPASPAPVSGASGIATAPVLTWTSADATSYDVSFGTTNPPPQVTSAQTTASYAPATLTSSVTYFWQIVAHNAAAATTGPVWSFTTATAPADIVIYASDLSPSALHGAWAFAGDSTSPNATKLMTAPTGASNLNAPLAVPTDYVDVTFSANAGTPYTFWMRLEAFNNLKASDSVWVQFSDALAGGAPIYPLATTSALLVKLATDTTAASNVNWGWVNSAYWLTQPATVTFATTGTHTVRVQVRGAGVMFDQIVLSPGTYLNAAPGVRTNDSTIVPKSQAPGAPGSPSPTDTATSVSTTPTLTWTAADATSYDVSFGTTNPPAPVSIGQTATAYAPAALAGSATYFWQIVAHNSVGATTGTVWSFTTAAPPPPPSAPGSPSPADGATSASTTPTLTWSATGATSYDINFGTTNPPPLASSGASSASYAPTALANSTSYFWQIVAHNDNGATAGAVWSFTTIAAGAAPSKPSSPSPVSGATNVSIAPTLSWTSTGATSYDVKFGTTSTPPLVSSGVLSPSYTPAVLAYSTTYFWRIVARNGTGTATSSVWSFKTVAPPPPPSMPASPSPADGATGNSTTPTLTWSATGATSYDVNFGTSNPPPQVSAGQSAASFVPGTLSSGTTYFWQVVGHNAAGATSGPVWSFTTLAPLANVEIVIYASDIPSANLHGGWTAGGDPMSPNGVKLVTPDNGFATTTGALAAPTDYVDVTFDANAGMPYTLWLRMQALNNSKYNDSLWVQFSDAMANGASIYPMNTTSGLDVNLATDGTGGSLNAWGWQNAAYWLSQPATVTFATSGTHTMRIQVREDGVQFDQIVLSSVQYLTTAPGGVANDTTIVSKP